MITIRHSQDLHGLSAQEVEARRRAGQVNAVKSTVAKPLSRIFIDNICTLFNLVNVLIAIALIMVRSYHNLLFMGVAISNSIIGIVQELRSKHTLEKLSLLCAAKATVIRDGLTAEIPAADIVKDDVILFKSGDQISVDATVLDGDGEADESLLTGESDPIEKHSGDKLMSGSFMVSGHLTAVATHVGEDSYASKLAADAKKYKRLHSKLMTSINQIIRFTGAFMIPFAMLLVLRDYFTDTFNIKETVTATAAALIGMMPQGLMLLTTIALVVGVIKLAQKKTLVQELYCIETLSRVSLVCLDKTGTITKGTMSVSDVLPLSEHMPENERRALIATALFAIDDSNSTATALKSYYAPFVGGDYAVDKIYPFSSQKKWSAATVKGVGTVFFGAYDRLLTGDVPAVFHEKEQDGKRLILIALSPSNKIDNTDDLIPLDAVVLEDDMRDNAAEILKFFTDEGVTLRILSGDHPKTVSAIAKKAGLEGWDLAVDATTLRTDEELERAAQTYIVFGRVSPEQKKALVRLFKKQGHTVAMTGDGVNDVPALKEADCSVAIAAGSDAAKQVAQLVLLDSDFASLPTVVMEGRRVVNNITRTASLFLVKTVMSFLITLSAILLPMSYPFEPLQLTLIGVFAQSIPGFFLTLEPCRERIRGNFFHTVLKSAVPSAVMITVAIIVTQLCVAPWLALSAEQSSTLCVYLTGLIWLIQLLRVCQPLTPARTVMWVLMTVGFFGGALLLANVLPSLFALLGFDMAVVFVLPTFPMVLITAITAIIAFPLDKLLYTFSGNFFKQAM